jgi:hypothetical protein
MSSSAIISEVSALLRTLLEQGLTSATNQNPSVDLSNPADETSEKTLSIWLYQVTPNPFLRNAPNIRSSAEFERFPPVPLDLCYLMTPALKNEAANQATLGRALQVLQDNSILTLHTGNDIEELHLNICQRSITELAEVWEALQKPYRLSVCFEVRMVQIDSERVLPVGRVRERGAQLNGLPAEANA